MGRTSVCNRVNRPRLMALAMWTAFAPTGLVGQTADSRQIGTGQTSRFPGDVWLRYTDVAEAGFSAERLANAREFWEHRGAAALLVVSNGAVVASWGEIDRRFPIHSIRKSLLSALYGAFEDDIDLNQTLQELGIDDRPALSPEESQARVVDLISSRSGVYHASAGEPAEMTDGRPERGSHPPGRHWWYNNWDFNVAGTVFETLTDTSVLTAFGEAIAEPIGMQDYRVSDGFYNLEAEKSIHPSFGWRMSARDLARFGLLFARGGRWGSRQIIPQEWVEESTRSHSEIDLGPEYGTGYGYMWWVEGTRGFAARGLGGHVLAVYPADDLVMVIRADTYHDRFVSNRVIARLFDRIRDAREGAPVPDPRLKPLSSGSRYERPMEATSSENLARYVGEVRLEGGGMVKVELSDGWLTLDYGRGAFRLLPMAEGRFLTEDSRDPVVFELSTDGGLHRVLTEPVIYMEAANAIQRGDVDRAVEWVATAVETFPESPDAHYNLARALAGTGDRSGAFAHLESALDLDPGHREAAALLTRLRTRRYAPPAAILLVGGLLLALWIRRRRDPHRAAGSLGRMSKE
jgi:CubicO group peptidase (beta-lactamase class C family)